MSWGLIDTPGIARRVYRYGNTFLKTMAAVRTVGGGGTYLAPLVAGKLAGALTQAERLTPRARGAAPMGQGLADKEIDFTMASSTCRFSPATMSC